MVSYKRPGNVFNIAAKRRKLAGFSSPSRAVHRATAVAVKAPSRASGYGKRRRTYRKLKRHNVLVKANSTFRKAVKMIEAEDKEMKYTSVAHTEATIQANDDDSWTRIVAGSAVPRDTDDNITYSTIALYGDSAYRKVVTGDSIVKNREGAEIYTKRIDLHFDCAWDATSPVTGYLQVPYFHIRVWIVQAKHLASTTTPTFQLWQAEAKSSEIWHSWGGKPIQFFDPRSNTNSTQRNQFKVLKKLLIKVKNPYYQSANMPYVITAGTLDAGTGTISSSLGYNAGTVKKQFFRSVNLKNCVSTMFGSDTSGEPSMGNIFVMTEAWSPYNSLKNSSQPYFALYARACYKEDPGC